MRMVRMTRKMDWNTIWKSLWPVNGAMTMQDQTRMEDKSTGHKTLLCFTQDIKERQESLSLCLLGATVSRRPQEWWCAASCSGQSIPWIICEETKSYRTVLWHGTVLRYLGTMERRANVLHFIKDGLTNESGSIHCKRSLLHYVWWASMETRLLQQQTTSNYYALRRGTRQAKDRSRSQLLRTWETMIYPSLWEIHTRNV